MSVLLDDFETVLSTTRAVRRRLDFEREVPRSVLEQCVALAQQAPTGGNAQDWRFVFVGDEALRQSLGAIYFDCYVRFVETPLREQGFDGDVARGRLAERNASTDKMLADAGYLARNIARSPWLVVACACRPNPSGGAAAGTESALFGSVYPAVWSFNLALRARGLGTVITTLHLHEAEAIAALLGIPEGVTQCCLLPVAYTVGDDFRPAKRLPVASVAYWNGWLDE